MPTSSDISETPTMCTEDLLEQNTTATPESQQGALDDDVIHLMTAGNKVIKMKWTILALHSPVLRKRYEEDEDTMVIQVTGQKKHWKNILKVFEEDDMDTSIPLVEIKETMSLAAKYQMKVVEHLLLQKAIAMSDQDIGTFMRIFDTSSATVDFKNKILRWLYTEKLIGQGSICLDKDVKDLWLSIKTMHMKEGEEAAKERLKGRFSNLGTLMRELPITVCRDPRYNCHWTNEEGNLQSCGSRDAAKQKGNFAACVIWTAAFSIIEAHAKAVDMPTPAMALDAVEKEVLTRCRCADCTGELRTLMRITRLLAKERKLL